LVITSLSVWRGLSVYQVTPSKESLLRAARANPSNPDPYYRLGLFYEWDLQNIDLRKSLDFFREAVERNPLEQHCQSTGLLRVRKEASGGWRRRLVTLPAIGR
jgi:hypothetical protein